MVRDAWLWSKKSSGGCEFKPGLSIRWLENSLCQPSSKWVPYLNLLIQRKEFLRAVSISLFEKKKNKTHPSIFSAVESFFWAGLNLYLSEKRIWHVLSDSALQCICMQHHYFKAVSHQPCNFWAIWCLGCCKQITNIFAILDISKKVHTGCTRCKAAVWCWYDYLTGLLCLQLIQKHLFVPLL